MGIQRAENKKYMKENLVVFYRSRIRQIIVANLVNKNQVNGEIGTRCGLLTATSRKLTVIS